MNICNLRASRESMDLKQIYVAKILKVHKSTYSNWENNYDTIPLKKLIYYANYFSFSLDFLFGISSVNNYKYISINLKTIGFNLKKRRMSIMKTRRYVVKKAKIDYSSYCDFENGKRLISTSALYSLSLVYKDFSFDDVFIKKIDLLS